MTDKQRKLLFIIGGAVAALLVIVLLLLLLLGGNGNKESKYDRFYAAAEDAYRVYWKQCAKGKRRKGDNW